MKHIKTFLTGTLLLFITFSCDKPESEVTTENQIKEYTFGINRDTIKVDNQDRNFKFYVPQNLSEDASLVFRFHGSVGISADPDKALPDPVFGVREDYVLNQIADTENIVVVFPVGSKGGTSIGWTNKDEELKFFDEMLEYFKLQVPKINFDKVYVCGHSSGAIFSFVLAGSRADKIAAAVPVSGQYRLVQGKNDSFVSDNFSVPLRAYNGTIDGSVNYQSAYRNMNIWEELENKGDSTNRVISNFSIADYNIEKTEWKSGLSDLELYSLQGVGHGISWKIIGESMWEFMKSHTKK